MGVDWTADGRPQGPIPVPQTGFPPHPLPAIPVPQTGFPYYTTKRLAQPLPLFPLVVLVETPASLATQPLLLDHLLEEGRWLIRWITTLLVARQYDVIHNIDAAEIGQFKWSHRVIQAELEGFVDILVRGDAFCVQVERRLC